MARIKRIRHRKVVRQKHDMDLSYRAYRRKLWLSARNAAPDVMRVLKCALKAKKKVSVPVGQGIFDVSYEPDWHARIPAARTLLDVLRENPLNHGRQARQGDGLVTAESIADAMTGFTLAAVQRTQTEESEQRVQ